MNKIKYLIFFAIIINSTDLFSQSGSVSLYQTNNGSTIDVSIYIKRTGAVPWNLGFASFVFGYNNSAMNSPVEAGEGMWDNNSNAQYDDQTVAQYNNPVCASVEIGLAGISTGTNVPADSTLIGKVRFNISNPAATHNLNWNTQFSAILDNNGNNITQNMLFVNPLNSLLPVELTSFVYQVNDNNVILRWTTVKEINNAGFYIQRKNTLITEWTEIGFLQGHLNSQQINQYEFTDLNLPVGNYNYRLKQTDINGNFEYFNLNGIVNIGIPNTFNVFQNYPNPFNPSTTIKYRLSAANLVKITLFNLLGKEIKVLLSEYQEAGYHSVLMDGENLSSGIYFYKLESGNDFGIKFLTIVK